MTASCELTILMPCLNEAETVERCIRKARTFLAMSGISGEILIADNGSTDGSQRIAASSGARVVDVERKGYGSALMAGIEVARGKFVIMGDSDDSYDFSSLERFVDKLREGYDLVIGNRFRGGIAPGAMPPLHRYLGNPILTMIGRTFFKSPCGDFHCGLRGFRRDAALGLELQAEGMEFASEMVVKASIRGLRVTEVPTTLSPDGRSRPPHLRSWRDGWRHLRFLLVFSPRWLFLYPGACAALCGAVAMAWLLPEQRRFLGVTFDVHTLFYAAVSTVAGVQSILFWVFAKTYGMRENIVPRDPWFHSVLDRNTLEVGLIAAAILFLFGIALGVGAVTTWGAEHFGPISPSSTMRLVIPSGAAILLAFQLAYACFFVELLKMRSRTPAHRNESLDRPYGRVEAGGREEKGRRRLEPAD